MTRVYLFSASQVRRLRGYFKENRKKFAKRLGVTHFCVRDWERGNRRPSIENMITLEILASAIFPEDAEFWNEGRVLETKKENES